ncbi:MAG: trehalase family glycosidase, partial [Bacteroidota bacterium]
PKMVASHRFFYTHRDPEGEGLAFIFHPWESGRDNSPLWDNSLSRIKVAPGDLPAYERRDLDHADASHRPTQQQYDAYVYLLELGKRNKYDGPGIFAGSPFLVQDTLINGILIQSNASLIRLGQRWGEDTSELEAWQERAIVAYQRKLWNEELGTFTSYDLRAQEPIAHREIGAFTALSARAATEEQAKKLNDYLLALSARGFYLCPSFDVDSPLFDSCRYWRGPVWPQMNWLIHYGLLQYGLSDTAELVRSDFLQLVGKHGFWEYFEADKALAESLSHGYGGNNFSWTAASWLELREGLKVK